MESKIHFSAKEILNYKFKRDVKGYDAYEVDSFLDEIIKDYQQFEKVLEEIAKQKEAMNLELVEAKKEIESLKADINRVLTLKRDLEVKNASMENRLGAIRPEDAPSLENLALLRKCRAYEEFLYSHGYDPKSITSTIKN